MAVSLGAFSLMNTIDVAAGTGITARAILDIVGDKHLVTCVEPSAGMIVESKKLLDCEHIQAEAESMPLEEQQYDFLTMGFALRHVDNLDEAFIEYCRVLKPGGKALILDVTTPENPLGYFFMKLYFKTLLLFLRASLPEATGRSILWPIIGKRWRTWSAVKRFFHCWKRLGLVKLLCV